MITNSNFIDEIKVFCRSGNGGAGSRHFMRTKCNSKGGPDGGDGGKGGSIILVGNKHLWTLLHLRYHKNIIAKNGGNGNKNHCSGKNGDDIIIEVPLGTIVKNADTKEKELEILEHNERKILLEGGKGGRGNSHFKSATNQAPTYSQAGIKGEEGLKIFELKLLADVGLVGFPNAGKSTLLSTISNSKTKIADYEFTTLYPELGIVAYQENYSFCMADLPGIIVGASEGKGLGLRFLRHIERNSILIFLISCEEPNLYEAYLHLVEELKKHDPTLLDKDYIIVISKIDIAVRPDDINDIKKQFPNSQPYFISSATNVGLEELKEVVWKLLQKQNTT